MMDEHKFDHDRSCYERPNFPFRCGRVSMWQSPCHQGPNMDGTCGGTTECTPFLNNGRWECRRPNISGGPCEAGPGPRGECSQQRRPCAPRPTLRIIRTRLIILSIGLILALVGATQPLDPMGGEFFNVSDAGPLSRAHKQFTEIERCNACHVFHGKGPGQWVKAVFTKTDISAQCVDCHSFGGPSFSAHNGKEKKFQHPGKTKCIMCHREHNGADMQTRVLTSEQCNSCHKIQFKSFAKGHPEFPKGYPYISRNAIKFDHVSHLKKHFEDPKFTGKAPKACIDCHTVTLTSREVQPAGFETICADCHNSQIIKKDLVLMRLPEFTQNLIDRDAIEQACEVQGKSIPAEEEFLSVSVERPVPITSFLLSVPEDDPDSYNQPLQELIMELAENSTGPLADLINARTKAPMADKLLAGLNPEVLKRAACAWGLNREYDPPAEARFGGWHSDLLEVRYTPSGHLDPVAKSWIEFGLAASEYNDEGENSEQVRLMRDMLIDPKKGVGGCIKCHAITSGLGRGENTLFVEWNYREDQDQLYVRYSHSNHIEILGNKDSCITCHILNKEAEYSASFKTFDPSQFKSNFTSIEKRICMQCHTERKIKQDCQLCHLYHYKPSFKKEMLAVNTQN